MDPQRGLRIPIPIIEEIISLSALIERLTFRMTCKRLLAYVNSKFFPTFALTFYGQESLIGNMDCLFGALNSSSTTLFLCHHSTRAIERVDLFTHEVTPLVGSPYKFQRKDEDGEYPVERLYPGYMAFHERDNILFTSDSCNHIVAGISLDSGKVTTVYGWQQKCNRVFADPRGLALDPKSNHLYVADNGNHSIKRILLDEGHIETLCGREQGYADGTFEEAMFYWPTGIVWNPLKEELYVSDFGNCVVRVVSPKDNTVRTLCGTPKVDGYQDGPYNQAKFRYLRGIGLDIGSNYLYICDSGNYVVRRVSLLGEVRVTTLCGTPLKQGNKDGLFPLFESPSGIAVDTHSGSLYVMDWDVPNIKKVTYTSTS